jgi:hypothetical protein
MKFLPGPHVPIAVLTLIACWGCGASKPFTFLGKYQAELPVEAE